MPGGSKPSSGLLTHLGTQVVLVRLWGDIETGKVASAPFSELLDQMPLGFLAHLGNLCSATVAGSAGQMAAPRAAALIISFRLDRLLQAPAHKIRSRSVPGAREGGGSPVVPGGGPCLRQPQILFAICRRGGTCFRRGCSHVSGWTARSGIRGGR